MNPVPDVPGRPTAQEAIRTVFAGGAVAIGIGLVLSGTVALGVLTGGSVGDALFRSAGVVIFTGFGTVALTAAFLAHHFRRRYQLVPRDSAADERGDSA